MRYLSRLSASVLAILILTFSLPALAASGIKDNAGMFSSKAVMEADATIAKIKTQFKDDLLIETFPEVPAEMRGNLTEANKAEFFEQWARERARQNQVDGVYILLTKDPGRLQVEVGNNTQKREFTLADREALTRRMLEPLKANQADQALLTGVKFVHDTYAANLGTGNRSAASGAAAGGAGSGAPAAQRTNDRKSTGFGLFGGSCFLWVIIAGVIFLLFRVLANRNRAGSGPGGYGPGRYGQPGPPPHGQPGYGQPGQPPYGATGGGGFGRGLLGGLLGGMAGGYLWDRMSGRSHDNAAWGSPTQGSEPPAEAPPDTDYSGGGADFGGGGGSDFGGGGDSGGGGGDF